MSMKNGTSANVSYDEYYAYMDLNESKIDKMLSLMLMYIWMLFIG